MRDDRSSSRSNVVQISDEVSGRTDQVSEALDDEFGLQKLSIVSRGERLVIARELSPPEREHLADELGKALSDVKPAKVTPFDQVKPVIERNERQTRLQAALKVTASLKQMSLLDYL